jgi:hypothetical protein
MIDWWSETDEAIVGCLRATGPMSPEELACRIGLSVGEIGAFLAMLMREGRVHVRIVELTPEEESTPIPASVA